MKRILFITEFQTANWAFMNEIMELENLGFTCFVTDDLDQAKKILDGGVDKVVMFPIAISHLHYKFNPEVVGDKNLKFFIGFCFWKQELAEKKITTIIVNIYNFEYSYMGEAMTTMEQQDWKNDPHVVFFTCDDTGPVAERELVELITS